jgi:tripartite-type tricarboxylate transporter receptor subunit TctC
MNFHRRQFLHLAAGAATLPTASRIASAQTYPSRSITVIMGLPPGAGTDAIGRTIFEHMKSSLGQPVVVENAPGAGGTIATARAARAAPDGYTLSLGNLGTHTVSPATYPNIQYHPLDHFEPVALLGTTSFWMVARKDFPAKDLYELIAWLKANPDKATAGMIGSGGIDQIAGTYFQRLTGTQFRFVPYRGGPPIVQDLVAGHVDMWVGGSLGALGQVHSGQLKAYAVLSDRRWFAAPDVPTAAEFGVRELTVPFWMGLWAPKGTPRDIVAKLNAAVLAAQSDAVTRQRLLDQGVEPRRANYRPRRRSALSTRPKSKNGGRSSRPPASKRSDLGPQLAGLTCRAEGAVHIGLSGDIRYAPSAQ